MYIRTAVKIKKALIHKAKVKKTFSKTIAKEESSTNVVHAAQANKYLEEAAVQKKRENEERAKLRKLTADAVDAAPPKEQMHPQRQAALKAPETREVEQSRQEGTHRKWRPPKPKTSSFKREEEYAANIQAEREAAAKEAELKRKAHEHKDRERQRRKKVMSARTGKGQQKLGRQGAMLLDKVKAQLGIS